MCTSPSSVEEAVCADGICETILAGVQELLGFASLQVEGSVISPLSGKTSLLLFVPRLTHFHSGLALFPHGGEVDSIDRSVSRVGSSAKKNACEPPEAHREVAPLLTERQCTLVGEQGAPMLECAKERKIICDQMICEESGKKRLSTVAEIEERSSQNRKSELSKPGGKADAKKCRDKHHSAIKKVIEKFEANIGRRILPEYASSYNFASLETHLGEIHMCTKSAGVQGKRYSEIKLFLFTAGRRFGLHRDIVFAGLNIMRYLMSCASFIAFVRKLGGDYLLHVGCASLCISSKYHDASQPISYFDCVRTYNELNNDREVSGGSIYFPLLEHCVMGRLPANVLTQKSISHWLDWFFMGLDSDIPNGIWHTHSVDVADNEDSPAYCLVHLVIASELLETWETSNLSIALGVVFFFLKLCSLEHKAQERKLALLVGEEIHRRSLHSLNLIVKIVLQSHTTLISEFELGFLASAWWKDLRTTTAKIFTP